MAQQPDLQAILATLAQYSQQNNTEQPPQQTPYQPVEPNNAPPSIPEDNNPSAILHNARVESPVSADPRLRGRPQSRSITPAQPPKQDQLQLQQPSVIDPATITVWQDALRCVTKIAAQNKMFETTIRRVSLFWCHTDSIYPSLLTFQFCVVDDARSKIPRNALVHRTSNPEANANQSIILSGQSLLNPAVAQPRRCRPCHRAAIRRSKGSRTSGFRPQSLLCPALDGRSHDGRAERPWRTVLRHERGYHRCR